VVYIGESGHAVPYLTGRTLKPLVHRPGAFGRFLATCSTYPDGSYFVALQNDDLSIPTCNMQYLSDGSYSETPAMYGDERFVTSILQHAVPI